MRPPPDRDASEWAEAKRILPKGSAEPGPFRPDRAPWVRVITQAVKSPLYSAVCGVFGSQMSKTDGILLNIIGWKLDDDPQPMLYFGPTQKNVESIAGSAIRSKGRVGSMIRSVPSLWDGLAKGKDEKITEKYVNGVRLGFGWAGSPTEMASHPAAIALVDEVDRMVDTAEGDPRYLIRARLATFPGAKEVSVSTPLDGYVETETLETGLTHWKVSEAGQVSSPSWLIWQSGTRHEWTVPCLHCDEYFIPRSNLFRYPEGATDYEIMQQACLVCPHCGAELYEKDKPEMNARGRAVSPGQSVTLDGEVVGEGVQSMTFSLWVSGLMSPFANATFGHRAIDLRDAKGDPGKEKSAINTGLGELYGIRGDAPAWQEVYAHRYNYRLGEVPDFVTRVTAGVDVQKDRLVFVVRGWGDEDGRNQSALLDYGELFGPTSKPEVWELLAKQLEAQYDGRIISRAAIDSGYNPGEKVDGERQDIVYHFCRGNRRERIPTKGRESLAGGRNYYSVLVDVNWKGKTIKNGVRLWHFDTDAYKSWVHDRITEDLEESGWYLPMDITESYCKQIVAEERREERGKARWIAVKEHNHYFDCEVLAKLAAATINVDRAEAPKQTSAKPQPKPDVTPAQEQAREQGSWLQSGGGTYRRGGWLR